MELKWTSKARSDLHRLHDFLSDVNRPAAARTVRELVSAPTMLITQPRIGEQLKEFAPREVRHIFVGQYEIRYEVTADVIFVLRVWHGREDR